MDRRIWIVLAVAGVALVAWRFWPEGGSSSSPPAAGTRPDSAQEDAPSPTRRAAGERRVAPPAPVRMQARSGNPAGPRAGVSIIFEAEDRDEAWASPREAEVRVRAGRVLADAAVAIGDVECRSRSCRFSIAADDPAVVARAIERLGDETGGFYRYADQMTIETAEPGEGGPRRVNVYLRFTR